MWLLVALAGVALLPALPLDLAFVYDNRPAGPRALHLAWGFGLIRVRLRGGRTPKADATAAPRERPRAGGRRAWATMLTPGLPGAAVRRIHRIFRSIRVRLLEARACIGTGDPADTGVLVGNITGALAAIPSARRICVTVVPDFEGPRSDLRIRGRIRVVPGVVLWHVLALCLAPTGLRAMARMARA